MKNLIYKMKQQIEFAYLRKKIKYIEKIKYDIVCYLFDQAVIIGISNFKEKRIHENKDIGYEAIYKLIDYKIEEKNKDILEQIQEIKDKLLKDKEVCDMLSKYYLLKEYVATQIIKEESINIQKAKEFNPDANELNNDMDIYEIKKDAYNCRNSSKKELKILIDKNIDKKIKIKPININFALFTKIITLISIYLVIGGFVYNYILFQNFNLNISNFFTVSDYLESSIDAIATIVIATIVSSVYMILGALNAIRNNEVENELNIKKGKDWLGIFILIFTILFIGILIEIFINYKIVNYSILEYLILISFYFTLLKFFPWDSIENNKTTYLIAMITIFFFNSLVFKAIDDSNSIKVGKTNKQYKLKISTKENISKFSYIKSISKYSFLYDNENNETIVIPNSIIDKVIVTNREYDYFVK